MTVETETLIRELQAASRKHAMTDTPLAALLLRAADEIDFQVKLAAIGRKLSDDLTRII